MDKREQIDKVLRAVTPEGFYWSTFVEALAEQAIVIECEVLHRTLENRWGKSFYDRDKTIIRWRDDEGDDLSIFHPKDGYHGTPGKALAIVISLEE